MRELAEGRKNRRGDLHRESGSFIEDGSRGPILCPSPDWPSGAANAATGKPEALLCGLVEMVTSLTRSSNASWIRRKALIRTGHEWTPPVRVTTPTGGCSLFWLMPLRPPRS